MLNVVFRALGFFPCPGCGGDGSGRNDLCPDCLAKLRFFREPHCPGCGGELDGVLAQCSGCLRQELRPWRYAVSCFAYENYGKELIRRFKFGDFPELARPFGRMAAEKLKTLSEPMDLMTAVPLFPTRYWHRSFNQSALFAKICAKELGVPFRQVLYRTRPTPHQSSLPRKDRLKNLKGAFVVYPWAEIKGLDIWLADDVFTTGSTLHEAARTLLKGGAKSVRVLSIARTL